MKKLSLILKELIEKAYRLNKRTWLLIAGGSILIILLIMQFTPKSIEIAVAEVQNGEFIVDLKIKGEIDALNSTNVSVPRMRRHMSLQIVDMVPEGTIVKKGDFLLRLDKSAALQRVDEANEKLVNAKAELESEKANISSNQAQMMSQLEQQKYSYQQAELNLKMMQYEAETKKKEVELNMKKAELALTQAEKKIESQKIIDRVSLMKAELKVRQAESALEDAKKTVKKLTITSPMYGLVVYMENRSGSERRKMQVGDTPYWGMPVMKIPDLSVMQVRTMVDEVDIDKIKMNQNVIIKVEALEGELCYGKITRIATLARKERKTRTKVFDVEVTVDSTELKLRPGMTCECRIITKRIPDVKYIPIQSVFYKEDKTVVYVKKSSRIKIREISTGINNDNYIVVEEGLNEEEKVCLRDPTVPMESIGGEGGNKETLQKPSTKKNRKTRRTNNR
jgi:RND family efflux transporter MFP subunit